MRIAPFQAAGLYVWSRHRNLLRTVTAIYLAFFIVSAAFGPAVFEPYRDYALTFLRAAPFFLPLLVFVSAASVARMELAGRETRFPVYFFALPLTTRQVVLPFMSGAILMSAVMWAAGLLISGGQILVAGPRDARYVEVWFPFLTMSLLAWTQVFIWMSFRRRWLRVFALLGVVFVHQCDLMLEASQTVSAVTAITLNVAQLLLACFAAVWGVARARRGEPSPAPARHVSLDELRPVRPFKSALQAQGWFESRLHRAQGKTLSVVLALAIFVTVSIAAATPGEYHIAFFQGLGGILLVVVALAMMLGPVFASFQLQVNWYKTEAFTMPPFIATLPLSTGDFAWLKLKNAARGMAWFCLLMVVTDAIIAALTGSYREWAGLLTALRNQFGALEATMFFVVLGIWIVLLAIANCSNTVWFALIGRGSHIVNSALLALVIAVIVLGSWLSHDREALMALPRVLEMVLPVLAALKLAMLAFLVHRVGSRALYSWSRLGRICGCWLAAVGMTLAIWMHYTRGDLGSSFLEACAFVVLLPVLGIVGAPLALQLNRCR